MSELTILNYIEGWRFWGIIPVWKTENEISFCRLKSLDYGIDDGTWFPRNPMKAICITHPRIPELCKSYNLNEPVPHFDGKCGIYAFKSKENAAKQKAIIYSANPKILGKVALWGKVIEHEIGCRGEWAYPFSLELGVCWKCKKLFPLGQTWLLREIQDWWLCGIIISCNSCLDITISYGSRFFDNSIIISPPGWNLRLAAEYGIPKGVEEKI